MFTLVADAISEESGQSYAFPKASAFHGCRVCDYDQCRDCFHAVTGTVDARERANSNPSTVQDPSQHMDTAKHVDFDENGKAVTRRRSSRAQEPSTSRRSTKKEPPSLPIAKHSPTKNFARGLRSSRMERSNSKHGALLPVIPMGTSL